MPNENVPIHTNKAYKIMHECIMILNNKLIYNNSYAINCVERQSNYSIDI